MGAWLDRARSSVESWLVRAQPGVLSRAAPEREPKEAAVRAPGLVAAAPSSPPLEAAIQQLARTMPRAELERFFGPGAGGLRFGGSDGLWARLGLPLSPKALAESQAYPVALGRDARLYRGDIYLNQHYAKTSYYRRDRPFEEVKEILMSHQPWLEWSAGAFHFHPEGAEQKLKDSLGSRMVYRTTCLHEAAFFFAVKDLAALSPSAERWREIISVLKETEKMWTLMPESAGELKAWIERLEQAPLLSAPEREQLAVFLVELIHESHCQGPGAASHAIFAAARPQKLTRIIEGAREVTLRMPIDFTAFGAELCRGTYFGIEDNYVEIAFMSAQAKLRALEDLERVP